MAEMLVLLALALVLAAGVLLWVSRRERRASGLPEGRIAYSDTGMWNKLERPLYDPTSGLTGKPDYLVTLEDGKTVVPVEVKSSRAPSVPHDSHVYQLAAYCRLVERTQGQRPPYGLLRYRDKTFTIDYTPALENELELVLSEIQRQEKKGEASRSHQEEARCARCGFRAICDQRL
jgi:CRISPR-associated exonuclease Cas4